MVLGYPGADLGRVPTHFDSIFGEWHYELVVSDWLYRLIPFHYHRALASQRTSLHDRCYHIHSRLVFTTNSINMSGKMSLADFFFDALKANVFSA